MILPFVFVFMQTLVEEVFCKCLGWRSFIKSCRGERRLLCNSVINQRQHFKDALRIKHNYKKWVSSQIILGDSVIKIRRRGVFTRARDIAYIFTLVKCLMSPGLQITERTNKKVLIFFFWPEICVVGPDLRIEKESVEGSSALAVSSKAANQEDCSAIL